MSTASPNAPIALTTGPAPVPAYEPPVAAWAYDAPAFAAYAARVRRDTATTGIHLDRHGVVRTDEGNRVVAIDTETGGFVPETHALLSIAAIPLEKRYAVPWSAYITPESTMVVDARAVQVNGLTPEALTERGAVREAAAIERLRHLLTEVDGGRPVAIVAHRAAFDVGFLDAAARRQGVDLPIAQILDTHPVCMALRDTWPTDAYAGERNTLDTFRSMVMGRQDARGTHTAEEDTASLAACVRVLAHRHMPVASLLRATTAPMPNGATVSVDRPLIAGPAPSVTGPVMSRADAPAPALPALRSPSGTFVPYREHAPLEAGAMGSYEHRPGGGLLMRDGSGTPFAFLVAHHPTERFFVSCRVAKTGTLHYMYGLASQDGTKLGIDALGYGDQIRTAETWFAQVRTAAAGR